MADCAELLNSRALSEAQTSSAAASEGRESTEEREAAAVAALAALAAPAAGQEEAAPPRGPKELAAESGSFMSQSSTGASSSPPVMTARSTRDVTHHWLHYSENLNDFIASFCTSAGPAPEARAVGLIEHLEQVRGFWSSSALVTASQWRAFCAYRFFAPFSRDFLLLVYLMLSFFEIPPWCWDDTMTCGDSSVILRSPLSSRLDVREVGAIQCLCLTCFLSNAFAQRHALGCWLPWSRFSCVACALALCDSIASCFNGYGLPPREVYWSTWCRPIVLLGRSESVQYFVKDAVSAILDRRVLDMIFMHITLTLIWAWFGVLMFAEAQSHYFSDYGSSWRSMFICFTTANFPDVMVDVYNESRFYFIYFCSYLVIVLYMTFNVLLAAMFKAYRTQVARRFEEEQRVQQQALNDIFDMLADSGPEGHSRISKDLWHRFWLGYCRHATEEWACNQGEKLFALLDHFANDPYFGIRRSAFQKIGALLVDPAVPIQRTDPVVKSKSSLQILAFMRIFVDVACAASLAVSVAQTDEFVRTRRPPWLRNRFESLVFHTVCLLQLSEVVIKYWVYGYGWKFWRTYRHCTDIVSAVSLVTLEVVALVVLYATTVTVESPEFVKLGRALSVLRVARIERLVYRVGALRRAIHSIVSLLTAFRKIAGGLILTFSFAAVVGIQLFGGQIRKDNAQLLASGFGQSNYYANNFNDFASGLVLLFELMVINNWYVIAGGLAVVAPGSPKVAWAFCIVFYVFNHIVILNNLIASVVECFDRFYGDAIAVVHEDQLLLDGAVPLNRVTESLDDILLEMVAEQPDPMHPNATQELRRQMTLEANQTACEAQTAEAEVSQWIDSGRSTSSELRGKDSVAALEAYHIDCELTAPEDLPPRDREDPSGWLEVFCSEAHVSLPTTFAPRPARGLGVGPRSPRCMKVRQNASA